MGQLSPSPPPNTCKTYDLQSIVSVLLLGLQHRRAWILLGESQDTSHHYVRLSVASTRRVSGWFGVGERRPLLHVLGADLWLTLA